MNDTILTSPAAGATGRWTVYRHENRLFAIAAVFSALVWLALIVGTFGIGLVYVAFGALAYLFVQSALIARLRGTGALVTDRQFPELMACVRQCAQVLGMPRLPEVYLYEGGGLLNAFAARFLGRNFVVLLSDIVDATEANPNALRFYVGHELGHIHRGHLKWMAFLLPARIFPFLGAAYSRAREYTCDRIGLACCPDTRDAVHALGVLAVGGKHAGWLNANEYVAQARLSSGFWMSFHELLSAYPWLVKRVAQVVALGKGETVAQPRRHLGAWLLAVPAGSGVMLVGAAVIAVAASGLLTGATGGGLLEKLTGKLPAEGLSSGALDPSSPDLDEALRDAAPGADASDLSEGAAATAATERAVVQALDGVRPVEKTMEEFLVRTGAWPRTNAEAKVKKSSADYGASIDAVEIDDGVLYVTFAKGSALTGLAVEVMPDVDSTTGEISWSWDYVSPDSVISGH